MKKLSKTVLAFLMLCIIASSCGTKQNGQLIGVSDRPSWSGINPYGMVYIPSGTLHIGPSDQDVSQTYIQRPKSISIQVYGKVQGVWYRASTKKKADELGLVGTVRNQADGSVEVLACGEEEKINALAEWLRSGPQLARVNSLEQVETQWQALSDFKMY